MHKRNGWTNDSCLFAGTGHCIALGKVHFIPDTPSLMH